MTNICFLHHSLCVGELDTFISRHGDGHISTQEAMRHIEKLLLIHFTKMTQFTPKHLGRAQGFGGYGVYRRVAIRGTSRTNLLDCRFIPGTFKKDLYIFLRMFYRYIKT